MENKNIDLSSLKINRDSGRGSNSSIPVKKVVTYLAVIAVVIIVSIFGYNQLFQPTPEIKLATATLVSASESNAVLNASGYVVAQRKAAVASKGTGRLVFLGVVEGDALRKEQVIARLDDADIKAQLEQAKAGLRIAEASLKDAENNYNRQKALFSTGSTSQVELDAAESRLMVVRAQIEQAKAGVVAAEVNLENTIIRAPFDGTVLTKNADVGEIVAPFAASASSKGNVVTMADMTSLQVETDVSESNIERILLNQDCEITLDAYPQIHYPGFVAKIVPTADRSKATVMVKVGFKKYDGKVLPEMSAKVNFMAAALDTAQLNKKPLLMIPSTAVVKRGGRNVVYKIRENKTVETTVTVGTEANGYIEVISGVQEGDKVVEKVDEKLTNDMKIKIKS